VFAASIWACSLALSVLIPASSVFAASAVAPAVSADDLVEYLIALASDARLHVLMALIAADFILGVSAALKRGEFEFAKLGRFYRTNVLPYMLSYGVLFVLFRLVPGLGEFIEETIITLLWAVMVGNLSGSLGRNIAVLLKSGGFPVELLGGDGE
jgi:hypothetical protein